MKYPILYAMAFYVFYIYALLLLGFRARYQAVKNRDIDLRYFKSYNAESFGIPESLIVKGRHFDNQFQAPMIFLITCVTYLVLPFESAVISYLAWAYIITRIIHSFVHLGSNKVQFRAAAFGSGWLLLILMWICLLAQF